MFKILKWFSFGIFSAVLISVVGGYIYLYVLPKGPELTGSSIVNPGKSSFVINAYTDSTRKRIRVWTFKPESWKDGGSILFVMHGMARNAEDYLDAWVEIAKRKNIFLVAPEFESEFYRITTNDYQEGNLKSFFGWSNPESEWAYTVVENIFDHIVSTNNFSNQNYNIFGHSAGGQFVHRMLLLKPDARIAQAIAANAGFYTFPDTETDYPYGLRSIATSLNKSLQMKLVILLGEKDNNSNSGVLRQTELAMKQGKHRLARGENFFLSSKGYAEQANLDFNWRLIKVPQVGHNYKKMALAAAEML
ncbi:MAG: hypothetical protein OQJ89_00270 [Kangiellaceae bacterium]|nr:hypothetical protein [Kangiellaceae bacterium]MCW9015373.1 hypothetical protein [Kangiellaceae bacterium]